MLLDQALLFGLLLQWDLKRDGIVDLEEWIKEKVIMLKDQSEEGGMIIEYLFSLLWTMWKARNNFIFNQKRIDPKEIIGLANSVWVEQTHTKEAIVGVGDYQRTNN